MTSIAFVLGVLPLMIATGAGSELRRALGTAVFFGMLGVTFFGLLFTPVFFVLVRWLGTLRGSGISRAPGPVPTTPAPPLPSAQTGDPI
jgi:HAE1 family hydrophobic/amphiphilic exporter-1